MLKKAVIGLAVVALMASMAHAGAVKVEGWDYTIDVTVTTTPVEVCRIPVKLKIPWWVKIHPQDPIMLEQRAFNTETGEATFGKTVTLNVCANFAGTLTAAVNVLDPGAILGGEWAVKLNGGDSLDFDPCCTPFDLDVEVTGAQLHNLGSGDSAKYLPACSEHEVAEVIIKVVADICYNVTVETCCP